MKTYCISALVLCLLGTSLSASPLTEARINKIINDVSVVEPGSGARKASLQDVIKGEVGVKTGLKSRSELLFQDETLTRIGPESYFSFTPGTRDMALDKGTMLLQVPKGLGGARIRTAAVTAAITGTTIMLENIPGKHLKVLVLEGSLRLSMNGTMGDSLLMLPGKMVIMAPNAKRIPDPVSVDIAKVLKSSSLVKMGGKNKPLPSEALIQTEIETQAKNKTNNNLVDTNLVILGGGTKVVTANDQVLAALDRKDGLQQIMVESTRDSSPTPVSEQSPTPTPIATATPTPAATATPTPASTATPTPGATATPTPGSTATPTPGATATPTPGSTATPTPAPTATPSPGQTLALVDPYTAPLSGSYNHEGNNNLDITGNILAKDVHLEAGNDIVAHGTITAEHFHFEAGHDALFAGVVRAKNIHGEADRSITFLRPIGANDIVLSAPTVSGTSINAPNKLQIDGTLRNDANTLLSSGDFRISGGINVAGLNGSAAAPAGAGHELTLLSTANISVAGNGHDGDLELIEEEDEGGGHSIKGLNADGGAAVAGSSQGGGNGGVINIGTDAAPVRDVSLKTNVTATSGANGNANVISGNGGTVNVTAKGQITASSTIKVSDSAAGRASRKGGNISLESRKTDGTAINVTSSAQLLALLDKAAPGPGGSIKFISAGGAINMSGTAKADRGTVDIRNNGANGVVNLTNATLHGDVVKVGVLGADGTLNVGGGTIDADSAISLYAAGSNGTVNFNDNVTLSGGSVKTISGNTVTVRNGKVVTVNGPAPASVYTNKPNYTGFGGNNSSTGTFGGAGAVTKPLGAGPGPGG